YSNGGHIALEIALRHPEVVRSLILQSAFFSRDGTDPRFWQGFDHAKLDEMPLDLRKAYLATAPHPEQLPSFFAKSVQRMRDFKGWTPAQLQTIRRPTLLIVGDRDIVRVEVFAPRGERGVPPAVDVAAPRPGQISVRRVAPPGIAAARAWEPSVSDRTGDGRIAVAPRNLPCYAERRSTFRRRNEGRAVMKVVLAGLVLSGALAQPAFAALKQGDKAPDFSAPASLAGKEFNFAL